MSADPGFDADAFKRFEHDGWTEVAARYHQSFGLLTEQTVESTLNAANVGAGQQILDLACGSGRHAAKAVARGAVVTGVDLSEAMVDQAAALCPDASFRVGDAEALPFEDRCFDAVVCGFGVLHFPRADLAVAEALRVLRPGGRFACSVWRPAEDSPFMALVRDAVAAHGTQEVGVPAGPPPYQFGIPKNLLALLDEAGFVDTEWQAAPVMVRLQAADEVFDELMESGVRARKLLEGQTPEAYAKILEHAVAKAESFRTATGIEIPRPAIIGSGARP